MRAAHPKIRVDLIYQEDPADDSRYFIKDPVRREYFRFNELQVDMMRALNGKRSLEDVCDVLEEEYEAEIPVDGVARFVARLEKNLLLDVTSYKVSDAKTRRGIVKYLDKRGLALRAKARDGSSEEGKLFEAATHQLHQGDPCDAANLLVKVLEHNPENERARAVLECIHEAFFKSKTRGVSHARLVHLFNPDRLLGFIDRVAGRFLFSKWGALLVVAIVVLSVPAAIDVLSHPEHLAGFGASDAVVAVLVVLFGTLIHELSHGLACKHFGGTVDDTGVMFFYGVYPGAYCDTSDSYLFQHRRQKTTVHLAGIGGDLVLQALFYQILVLTDPSFPLWKGMMINQLLSILPNIQNLIPLVKFDGYYALSDHLGIVNLRERALTYLRDRLQVVVLGVPSETPAPSPREKRIFWIFAPAAAVFTVFFIYGIWISFLLPLLVRHLGVIGLVIAALYFARLLGVVLFRHLWHFIRFVFRNRRQVFTVRRSFAFLVAGAGIALLLMAPWPLRIDGTMVVEPRSVAKVRAGESGLIATISVSEGERVEKGQRLAVIRSDQLERDRAVAAAELTKTRRQLEISRTGARSEDVAIAAARVGLGRAQSAAARGELEQARALRRLDVGSERELAAAAGVATQARGRLGVSRAERQLVLSGTRSEAVAELEATVRAKEVQLTELEERHARLEIFSPIAGVVVTKDLQRRLGEHLERGDQLLEVHDTSMWQARIVPEVGQPLHGLEVGQRVAFRAIGDAHRGASSTIARVLPPGPGQDLPIIETAPIDLPGWRSGMTGQARIYTPARSVAYRLIAVPIIQIVDFDLARL